MIQTVRPNTPRKWRDPQPTVFIRHFPVVRKSRAGIEYTTYKAFGLVRKERTD